MMSGGPHAGNGDICPNAVFDGKRNLCGCLTKEEWAYTLRVWEERLRGRQARGEQAVSRTN